MRGTLKAVMVLGSFFFGAFAAYPQSSKFLRVETGFLSSEESFASYPRTCISARPGTLSEAFHSSEPFDVPLPCSTGPLMNPVVTCNSSSLGPNGCLSAPRDTSLQQLEVGGKTGQKVLQARERVLEILQSENACTEWFRTKDPDPAATFRTLTFELDRKGQEHIVEKRSSDSLTQFYNPYVARVIQGNGSFSTITLNVNGAFFLPIAQVTNDPVEGGPISFHGVHTLQVGPYAGNTLRAQVVTLLHELGHLENLLPVDEGDRDGKSLQNTMEVLRNCRPEIEVKNKVTSQLALSPR